MPATYCVGTRTLRRSVVNRSGHVTVWLILCLGVIITTVAMSMDGGRMLEERRRTQAAADAASLAAAIDLYENYSINIGKDPYQTAKNAALASAAGNGYSNDGSTSIVSVNIPPQSGDFANQAGYVEVMVQSNLASGFSTGLTGGQSPVRARAVACGKPKNIGVLLLASLGVGLSVSGQVNANFSGVPLTVNSTNLLAISLLGSAQVTADSISVSGGLSLLLGTLLNGSVSVGVTATADPLESIAAPSPADYSVQAAAAISLNGGSVTLQPGVYQGGIAISGQANVTMMPGVYIMQGGGFQVGGQANVAGNGVVIYNTSDSFGVAGQIQIGGTGAVTLSAPTTGTYRGITLFQDRSVTVAVSITGNGNLQLDGSIYASAAGLSLTANAAVGVDLFGSGYIANDLSIQGSGSLQLCLGTNRPKVPAISLVE
jgi:hypothetical protein